VTAVEVLFVLLGLVAVGSAVLVVTARNMVHAALWLVVTLGAIAGVFLLLAAEFVAWVQVLIYVGAVVVLLLFALMLTRAPTGRQTDLTVTRAAPAAVVALLVGAVLAVTVVAGFGDSRINLDRVAVGSTRPADDIRVNIDRPAVGSAEVTGETIFRSWVLPFEVLSVLLLAALVGAIVLSRLRTESGSDRLDHPRARRGQSHGRGER
jgi:NADH-quinone oxidoreductase subunit J